MFLLAAVAIALITVPLAGGRLSVIAKRRPRWMPAIFGALAIQVLIFSVLPDGSPTLHRVLHVASYALAGVFVYANRSVPGMLLIGCGGMCNLVAITVNGGVMPASRDAQRIAGIVADASANSTALAHPRLLFLGDVFAIPKTWPMHNVFSIGDVIIAIGAGVVIHALSGSRLTRARLKNVAAVRDGDSLSA